MGKLESWKAGKLSWSFASWQYRGGRHLLVIGHILLCFTAPRPATYPRKPDASRIGKRPLIDAGFSRSTIASSWYGRESICMASIPSLAGCWNRHDIKLTMHVTCKKSIASPQFYYQYLADGHRKGVCSQLSLSTAG
ncbi:hypothetical protein DSL72_008517 [Monilinia vaccinii-corymbosi]|uniref:Uncharacterized protein n=1 Tax=Monilinia vaccinii-corymbosi TaxID=61207 RepID=A0A8A3PJS8_9HELO|nr:hypothetical protein DSL72_008517 [Monilinia vaccinii-corymbosi]